MKYLVARWLVSDKDRRSGRTFVLAAAHIEEAIRHGTSWLWDHAHRTKAYQHVENEVYAIAENLNLSVRVRNGILSQVTSTSGRSVHTVLNDEEEKEIASFRAIVHQLAFDKNYSEEVILKMVHSFLRDEIVGDVHSS